MKNRKMFFSLIAALLIVTTAFAPAVYAANPFNNVWKSSPESIQKFNEYIASLPEEEAALILADEELVFNMKLDSYWLEPSSTARAQSVVSLPLTSYPAGSFYSATGVACTCHSDRCTYSVPSGASTTNCYITSRNRSGDCIRYEATGSIQCKGFADYVYYEYTGHNIGSSYTISTTGYSSISNSTAGANLMKAFFEDLDDGSNVRVSVRNKTYNHSIIVCNASSTGIYLYDANRVGTCKVGYQVKTWSQLANMYEGIVKAWTA